MHIPILCHAAELLFVEPGGGVEGRRERKRIRRRNIRNTSIFFQIIKKSCTKEVLL
jgi:hypothetical protein